MDPERYIRTQLWAPDEEIVRYLVHAIIYNGKTPVLRPSSVKKRTGLPEIPKVSVRESTILKETGDFNQLGIELDNRTLDTQVRSLLADVVGHYKGELDHFFKRIITGNLSRDLRWVVNQRDLDHVSASMFILHLLGILIGSRVDWNQALREKNPKFHFRTRFGRSIPRADSVMLGAAPQFVLQAHDRINVVSFEPLRRLCSLYSQKNTIQSLGQNTIAALLNIPLDTARNRVSVFNLVLTERFIPHYASMGLRQRWILSKSTSDSSYWSRKESLGLIGKSLLGFSDSFPVTLHLEPISSLGPQKLPGTETFTTDFECISFRLDRFNAEEGRWDYVWKDPEIWKREPNPWNPQKRLWLHRSTETKNKLLKITSKQMRLIGALAANQGSVKYRLLLLELLGIKLSSIKARIDRLCAIGALSVLYHPLLEYSGLPEALMLLVPDISGVERDYLKHWISVVMPYSHIYWGNRDSLVAILRIPKNQTGLTLAFMKEFLSEGPLELKKERFNLSPIVEMTTSHISMPHRMFVQKRCNFTNII